MDMGSYLEKFKVMVSVAEKVGVIFYEESDIEDAFQETKASKVEW